jgi:CBS domain containing-hemolysin-like protein
MVVLGLVAALALVAANGLFVATEFAFVAVRRSRVEQLSSGGHGRARMLLTSLHDLDRYIAATQLGITMSSLALGWIGEPAVGHIVEPPIDAIFGSFAASSVAATISFIAAFTLITTLHIVLGELAPKTIALQRPESTALWVVTPIVVFGRIFRPFIWTMNTAGRLVVRLFGVAPAGEHDATLSAEELEIVIQASARAGLLSSSELVLARRALEFGEIRADQIMVPRTEVVALDSALNLAEILAFIERHPHTRYPVFEENLDSVLGILDTADLLGLLARGGDTWHALTRPALAIPESVTAEAAVAAMRDRRVQLAILVDEHGGTSGILTADEVLYRLLGRWHGARAGAGEQSRRLPGGNLLLSGLTLVEDVEEATGISLAGEGYDTLGGFIMARLGRVPRVGDRLEVGGREFRVMAMDGRRVERVFVMNKPGAADTGESAAPAEPSA